MNAKELFAPLGFRNYRIPAARQTTTPSLRNPIWN